MRKARRSCLDGFRRLGRRNSISIPNPYATALAAYDFGQPGSYVENAGRIETVVDLSPNGRDLAQPTAADRPVIGTMADGKVAAVYTNAEEWHFTSDTALATIFNNAALADFTVTIVFELAVALTAQTLVGWTNPATATDEGWIGISATGQLRIFRENATPTSNTINSATTPFTATGITYVLTVTFAAGLVNAWVNGTQVVTDTPFAASTPTINASLFSIGARDQATDTQGVEGYIHSVVIEAN